MTVIADLVGDGHAQVCTLCEGGAERMNEAEEGDSGGAIECGE